MSVHRSPAISAPGALRLAGLVMLLAGLFGMHGLTGSSGPSGSSGMGMAQPTGTAPSGAMSAAEMTVPASGLGPAATGTHTLQAPPAQAVQVAEPLSGALSGAGHGGMAMNITMMCLAVLGAALIAVLGFLRRGRAAPVMWSLPHRRPRPVRHRGRDPNPPSLIKLSIQRC